MRDVKTRRPFTLVVSEALGAAFVKSDKHIFWFLSVGFDDHVLAAFEDEHRPGRFPAFRDVAFTELGHAEHLRSAFHENSFAGHVMVENDALSENGLIVVVASIDSYSGEIVAGPEIICFCRI